MELRPCVERAVTVCQPEAGRPVSLKILIEPEAPAVIMCDPTRLHQVLVNLISNAVKFTPAGSVTVSVGPDQSSLQSDDFVRFSIIDNGPGIPAEKIGNLFKPFSQIDSSSTRKQGGTGLGLAICKNLIQLMGGEIRVDSRVGKGSTFILTLPLAPRPAAVPVPPSALPPAAGLRVLVAQNHDLSRQLSLLSLEKLGCRAEAVENGAAVLERFEKKPFDAMLFDMRLADMDGYALAAAIRRREKLAGRMGAPSVRLIALVSADFQDSARTLSAAGINATLGKAATLTQLQQVLLVAGH